MQNRVVKKITWEGLLIDYRAVGIKGGLGFPFFCLEFYLIEKNIVLDLPRLISPGDGSTWKI